MPVMSLRQITHWQEEVTKMNTSLLRHFRIGLALALLCSVAIYGTLVYRYSHDQVRLGFRAVLPSTGLAENDTNGTVPGDPKNGVRALQNFYSVYTKYKERHPELPKGGRDVYTTVLSDVFSNPGAYGFQSSKDIAKLLSNPDNQFSDDKNTRSIPGAATFASERLRPDGTPVLLPKPPGTRDAIAYSTTYIHNNRRQFANQRTTVNPVGFYQVLWDDGKVEQFPYDKVFYVLTGNAGGTKTFASAFPGQAGVPSTALSYNDYWTKVGGWDKAPRGSQGAKGVAFNGQSYR